MFPKATRSTKTKDLACKNMALDAGVSKQYVYISLPSLAQNVERHDSHLIQLNIVLKNI